MKIILVAALILAAAFSAHANVTLNGLFADRMVLQRDHAIPVFGTAEPGEKVSVTFGKQSQSTTAEKDGKWSVKLKPMKASKEGASMTIEGKNKITLTDILIGDVWVCSGQSNMERMLAEINKPDDIKAANFPLLRQYDVPKTQSASPCDNVKGGWKICTPQSAGSFSAVAFYFGRKLQKETGIPIGLIRTTWSGTPIEPWISPEGLAGIPEPMRKSINISFSPSAWHSLYNSMIHPLINFPIKGVIWYQGESNALFASDDSEDGRYLLKKKALITCWRKAWNIGDFPFYFVQLANFEKPDNKPAGGDRWARICAAQLKSLSIPNTGMAVAIDLANPENPSDIHPRNKKDVGERLALWALAKDYGKRNLVYSGPLYKAMKISGGKIRISFDNTGSGLMIARKSGYDPAVKDPGGKLARFAIAGENKEWVWADAVIEGNSVVVSSPSVAKPVAIRYAFSKNPAGCNLYNKEGLPASPFRTDNW